MRNSYKIKQNVVRITLNRRVGESLYALVDLADLPKLLALDVSWQARWSASANTFYVQARLSKNPSKFVQMHRYLMDLDDDWRKVVVDHKNHNGLDNRRKNIQAVTKIFNHLNPRQSNPRNTSGYRNVTFDKRRGKWAAFIRLNGHNKHLGYFDDVYEAGRKAKEYRQLLGIRT